MTEFLNVLWKSLSDTASDPGLLYIDIREAVPSDQVLIRLERDSEKIFPSQLYRADGHVYCVFRLPEYWFCSSPDLVFAFGGPYESLAYKFRLRLYLTAEHPCAVLCGTYEHRIRRFYLEARNGSPAGGILVDTYATDGSACYHLEADPTCGSTYMFEYHDLPIRLMGSPVGMFGFASGELVDRQGFARAS